VLYPLFKKSKNAKFDVLFKMRTPIAIFGFKDTLAGQIFEMLRSYDRYDIRYFVSINPVPDIDVERDEQIFKPRRIELVRNGTLFGLPVVQENIFDQLIFDRIKHVLVLEDDGRTRALVFERLDAFRIEPISFIHPSVVFGGQNDIGCGSIIFPNCYIGYKARIGKGTILQSGCSIEHHSSVGNFCDINPRLTMAGSSTVEDLVEINMCVDIINKVTVRTRARVGAGSLVMSDCDSDSLYYGRPAKRIRSLVFSQH
jgi:acetyltransferase-like isoleucine patch superfamily enzyme